MPTTSGPEIRTVADIIQVLTKCSKQEADVAEPELCKKPSSVAILLSACGIGTASIGMGGRLILTGAATSGGSVLPGVILGAAGIMTAKAYCRAAVDRTKSLIESPSGRQD